MANNSEKERSVHRTDIPKGAKVCLEEYTNIGNDEVIQKTVTHDCGMLCEN